MVMPVGVDGLAMAVYQQSQASAAQTAFLHRLLAQQEERSRSLGGILGGAAGSSADLGSVRGHDAREVFVDGFVTSPDVITTGVRERLRKKLPGKAKALMRDYFCEVSPLGKMRLLTYFGLMMGTLFDLGEECGEECRKDPAFKRLMAKVAMASVFVDQVANEGGTQYLLGWLLTGEEAPPFDSISTRGCDRGNIETYSGLCDPKFMAAALAWVRDVDMIAERQTKVANRAKAGQTRPPKQTPPPPPGDAEPKGKARPPKK